MPKGIALVLMTSMLWGKRSMDTKNWLASLFMASLERALKSMIMASAALPFLPSSREALAMGIPVISETTGLEIQEGLQPSLRDLGLVGSIGGVPARVFQECSAK